MGFFNRILIRAIIPIVSFLLFGCHVAEQQLDNINLSAQLVRVVSGQTIEVIIAKQNSQSQQVRLIGVDVPKQQDKEKDTVWNEQAKKKLKELLVDRNLNLELESNERDRASAAPRDRYNRIFAHVWHNDTLISEQLTKEGLTIANTKYPHQYSDRILHAQEYARILGYGIWGD
jgi:micrococcal nuclease